MAALTSRLPPIHVWFETGREGAAEVRRLIFEGAQAKPGPRFDVWWRVPDVASLPVPPVLDSFVSGHLLWAAMLGQDLVVHGPVSRGGMYNMGQLLEIRRLLSPERYPRKIEVTPDEIVEVARPAGEAPQAIAAFSGGLDSSFTAVRHARQLAGEASYRLAGLVMVHGFDASLGRPDLFDAMRRRSEPLARFLDLPLYTVITNSKEQGGVMAWPQSAIPLTGAALALFSGHYPVGLVSAGAPHGIARFSISHPAVLDALVSNDFFRVVTDGGGFGRADKIELLAQFPLALRGIKVCWEGDDPSRNCGHCDKCVLTRLNFLAAGIIDPPCFETPLERAHITGLHLPSVSGARDFFRFAWHEMTLRGCKGPMVDLLDRRLRRVPPDRSLLAYLLTRRPGVRFARRVWARLTGRGAP
jgi:hypothetical protein